MQLIKTDFCMQVGEYSILRWYGIVSFVLPCDPPFKITNSIERLDI